MAPKCVEEYNVMGYVQQVHGRLGEKDKMNVMHSIHNFKIIRDVLVCTVRECDS